MTGSQVTERKLVESVIRVTKRIFDDGRQYVDDEAWLNARLVARGILTHDHQNGDSRGMLKLAMRELAVTLSVLGQYSDIPLGIVFSLMNKAHAMNDNVAPVGCFITDDFMADEAEAEEYGVNEGSRILEVQGQSLIIRSTWY